MNFLLIDFLKLMNENRKTNKWYIFEGIVENKTVRLKGFKNWLQVYFVDDINYGNNMNRKVKEFNEDLERPFHWIKENKNETIC